MASTNPQTLLWHKSTTRNRAIIEEAKSAPCVDCGGTFPKICMDFDHRGEKTANIARMMTASEQRLRDEIAKCDVVCANCHRIRSQETEAFGSRR